MTNGFATPYHIARIPGPMSGCIYRSDGSKVALSERYGGHMGDHVISQNPDQAGRPGDAVHRPGRGLFLGHYMGGHYGHFITETLSTLWIFEEQPAQRFDYFLFYPFTHGRGLPDYVRFCFEAVGIDPSKIVFVEDEPLSFDELVVPARLLILNHSADPTLRWVYQRIASHAACEGDVPPKLYLSRRRFGRRNFERVVANEVHIERIFEGRGFQVIYPEEIPFPRQVALYNRAEVVAGLSGSGLHNSVFMRPDRLLVELGDPRYEGQPAPTQVLCNRISGVRPMFIPFEGRCFGPRWTILFDIKALSRRLDDVLGDEADSGQRRSARVRFLDHLEIAYRMMRPTLGWIAKGLLSWLRDKPHGPLEVLGEAKTLRRSDG